MLQKNDEKKRTFSLVISKYPLIFLYINILNTITHPISLLKFFIYAYII